MPARYHPVSPGIWDRRLRGVSVNAKLVHLYVLTCPQRVSEGLFSLPLAYAAADLGLGEEEILAAFGELTTVGLVEFDVEAEVVLDREALRWSPRRTGRDREGNPKPDKRIVGAVKLFGQVPESPLKAAFVRVARELSPDLAHALVEEYGDTIQPRAPSQPLGSPSEGVPKPRVETSREELEQSCERCGHSGDLRTTNGSGLLCEPCLAALAEEALVAAQDVPF